MIKNFEGKKITAKEFARVEILFKLMEVGYCFHENCDRIAGHSEMTDREKRKVSEQIEKEIRKIEKRFGYEPGSWCRV